VVGDPGDDRTEEDRQTHDAFRVVFPARHPSLRRCGDACPRPSRLAPPTRSTSDKETSSECAHFSTPWPTTVPQYGLASPAFRRSSSFRSAFPLPV
jgi:hypothetical protein